MNRQGMRKMCTVCTVLLVEPYVSFACVYTESNVKSIELRSKEGQNLVSEMGGQFKMYKVRIKKKLCDCCFLHLYSK